MKAPFPYFGGKSRAAAEVWRRFGDVKNYVEPFCGSAAVLLKRPEDHEYSRRIETINDADGMVANFWRALAHDPEGVAHHADWPVNEADLHARHLWLVGQREDLTSRLMGDPEWYDVKIAGWWVWGACAWIGTGWCSGKGPWISVDGLFTDRRQLPHLGNAGRGVNRQLPHLGNAGRGVNRQLPHLGDAGRGVNRQLPHLGNAGRGLERGVIHHLLPIAERIKNVRVACGDWTRVTGKSVTTKLGVTGVFLDPPYPSGKIDYNEGDREVYLDVQEWALERGDDPKIRIAVCGYKGDHDILEEHGWTLWSWKAAGGYGSQGKGQGRRNSKLEQIWFSPHCLQGVQI